jgi:PleD family two-component response regulator
MYPESGGLAEELMAKADAALYMAKKSGKRRTVR